MSEERFELMVSVVLIVGVVISGAVIAAGFLASFAVGWTGSLTGAPSASILPTSFGDVLTGLRDLRPLAIKQAGLLLLIATPVARVAISAVAFLRRRDMLYLGLTVAVLCILLASLFLIR